MTLHYYRPLAAFHWSSPWCGCTRVRRSCPGKHEIVLTVGCFVLFAKPRSQCTCSSGYLRFQVPETRFSTCHKQIRHRLVLGLLMHYCNQSPARSFRHFPITVIVPIARRPVNLPLPAPNQNTLLGIRHHLCLDRYALGPLLHVCIPLELVIKQQTP